MKKIEITDNVALEIIEILKNTYLSYDYIETKYGIKRHYISSINTGKKFSHLNENGDYPLRKTSVRSPKASMVDKLSQKQILEIIQLLREGEVKFEDIGNKYHINRDSVARINNGDFDTNFLNDITFPIRTKHIRQEKGANSLKFTEKEILAIVKLIKNTDTPFTEIAEKFNTTAWTISMINTGKRYTKILTDETFPLRKVNTTKTHASSSKLSEESIIEIIDILKNSKTSLRAIGRDYGVDNSIIVRINNGKAWNNITSKYVKEYPIRAK